VNNYRADSEITPDFSSIDPEAKKTMADQLETVSDWFPNIATEIESACEFFLTEE
jgi:hypothetical protein